MNTFRRIRWLVLLALLVSASGVSCVQAVSREAQFGALDGVNGFVADGVRAFLVAVVPFLKPAE